MVFVATGVAAAVAVVAVAVVVAVVAVADAVLLQWLTIRDDMAIVPYQWLPFLVPYQWRVREHQIPFAVSAVKTGTLSQSLKSKQEHCWGCCCCCCCCFCYGNQNWIMIRCCYRNKTETVNMVI